MTPATCQQAIDNIGGGVGSALRAVDCAAGQASQMAVSRLMANSSFSTALTIMLTMFVALLGFGLITGRMRMGVAALTPKLITMTLVLTFATSLTALQSTIYALAAGAPNEIAGWLMGGGETATNVFADKIDITFNALLQAAGDQAETEATSVFSPPGLMWLGATLLLLGTVGVLATCKIALAVLLALGPVFTVLALFKATRGLFTGWLKGVVLVALTPLFAVLGGSLMLELAVPVIAAIGQTPGKIEPRAAMAFFMIGAVHVALMIMVLKVAGTMVAGWNVFGLAGGSSDRADRQSDNTPRPAPAPTPVPVAQTTQAAAVAAAAARQIRMTGSMVAANDSGGAGGGGTHRETRIIAGAVTPGSSQPQSAGPSRARGIGSRFRSAPPRKPETK
ncbi:type VI secretion protein [Altererythrobacter xixiisoli]|uniref:Type VI secretion protein n=1 Tax=Croceibacterium xixiisoli TaxID=1476466 RepID=A0A6I4TZB3_9SPHN|nr:type IV secretion system protein [Croceibacterium xixiisoli]MXP00402.1 type VI secretion protein [Croceibacterium xixiisoli]